MGAEDVDRQRASAGTGVPGVHSLAKAISLLRKRLALGKRVAMCRGMTRLALLIAVVLLPLSQARAQEIEPPDGTRISSAQVSGIEPGSASPGLRRKTSASLPARRSTGSTCAIWPRASKPSSRATSPPSGSRRSPTAARVSCSSSRACATRDARPTSTRIHRRRRRVARRAGARPRPDLRDDLHALADKPLDSRKPRIDARG